MASFKAMNPAMTIAAGLILSLALLLGSATGEKCHGQCAAQGLCCSLAGYCGSTEPYCGDGCKEGPCATAYDTGVKVENVVTDAFFDSIINYKNDTNCEGKHFYSRSAFLLAASKYGRFGTTGASPLDTDDSKRDIAAFFAHVTFETDFLCNINETVEYVLDPSYCDKSATDYPCVPGKMYYGRGPLKLTWNYNYGPAGDDINFDGLSEPEKVGQDPVVSFKSALWFWMNHCHLKLVYYKLGFGETIRAINSADCDDPDVVKRKVKYYKTYCSEFGVSPGKNLYCS